MTGIVQSLIGSFGSVVSAVTDAYFNLVTLLLPGNGTNGAQNNTFLDSSSNNFTITRNGNTTQGTFSPFSQTGWSNFISSDGTAAFSVAYNAGFAPGSGDFTVEAWVYFTAVGGADQNIIGNISAATGDGDWFLGWRGAANRFEFSASSSGLLAGLQRSFNTTYPAVGQWYHVVGVKSGSTLSCYVNGSKGTDATLSTVSNGSLTLYIGQGTPGNGRVLGYISNARIVKGTAVYSGSSFTVPTAPLTAITNTQLLTCQSNRFVDNSTNNFTITVAAGTPSVQAFSPFAPTAAYSAATIGGSGYFDGSGDNLTTATNVSIGTQAFTYELFVYFTASPQGYLIGQGTSGGAAVFYESGVLGLARAFTGNDLTLTTTFAQNTWHHIVVVRSGTGTNQTAFFINGTRVATGTVTSNYSTSAFYVGGFTGASFVTGYISNARVVVGSAVYDPTLTTLTVPTAPLTAITNTSLLCNFTNAGITDATAKTDLETVGNAQISTTQSKWGGSSMYFDGTGDYLINSSINSPLYQFDSGDFTVEFWVYPTTVSVVQYLIDFRDPASQTTAGIQWFVSAGAKHGIYVGTTAIIATSTTSLVANTWTHLALVKNGTGSGNYKIYVNGTADATTGTNTTALTQGFLTIATASQERNTGTSGKLNGYMNDIRITKGLARYTSNFTPPTAAFPTR